MKSIELITYSKPNKLDGTKPQIRLALKEKKIYFNSRSIRLLGLRLERCVLFHQDKNNPQDWYLEIVENGGIPILGSKNHSYRCNTTNVIKQIFLSHQFQWKTGYVLINDTPTIVDSKKLYKLNFKLLEN